MFQELIVNNLTSFHQTNSTQDEFSFFDLDIKVQGFQEKGSNNLIFIQAFNNSSFKTLS
jgi:hypothetical protein